MVHLHEKIDEKALSFTPSSFLFIFLPFGKRQKPVSKRTVIFIRENAWWCHGFS